MKEYRLLILQITIGLISYFLYCSTILSIVFITVQNTPVNLLKEKNLRLTEYFATNYVKRRNNDKCGAGAGADAPME